MQYASRGMLDRVPAPIRNAPELRPWLEPVYTAFWELSTCRAVGMGEGPIPWTAIEAYATARGCDGEAREDLHFFVRAMDRAYLDKRAEQAEEERKRGGKAQPGSVRPPNAKAGRGRRARGR